MLNSIRYHPPSKSKRTRIRIISARHLPTNHALEGLQSQKCCYVLAHTTALATKFWELSLWFSLNFLVSLHSSCIISQVDSSFRLPQTSQPKQPHFF